MVVKWADTEKERQARRAQKAQSQGSSLPNADSQHPSLFGALPMGYGPPYNGYGYQVKLLMVLCAHGFMSQCPLSFMFDFFD